ncbi:TrmB family transcriptional regulator [archaeon]|jgi:HTH-type transcriptional regulator, sugar sensing transcriptional regulator|nr:TrmB family transcriptional regulator [archaeon]MBT6698247.1 TrmB family transcriptional regulator [archaeon]
MIVSQEFLGKLKDFGLNSYESKLWVALLSRGVSTAGELSDISSVPRSRTYDVLESLEKKGFIVVKVGKPIKYLAVSPSEVVERVKKRVLKEAEAKSNTLSKLKDSEVLTELNSLHTQGVQMVDPTDKSASFRGRDKVYDHMNMMLKNAKRSVHIMTTGKGLERKSSSLMNQLKKANKRGVSVTIAVPSGTSKKVIKEFSTVATVKENKMANARFMAVDGKNIMMMMTGEEAHPSYDSAVWVEAPTFVKHFTGMVENSW